MTISFSYPSLLKIIELPLKFYLNYEILFYSFDSIQMCLFLTNTNTKANIFVKKVPRAPKQYLLLDLKILKEYQILFTKNDILKPYEQIWSKTFYFPTPILVELLHAYGRLHE